MCVRVCVCLLSHTSGASVRLESTQHATKVKIFVAFSLKLRLSRATALPALYGHRAVEYFLSGEYACALL